MQLKTMKQVTVGLLNYLVKAADACLKTGFSRFDKYELFELGTNIIIAARPGVGKSMLQLILIFNIIRLNPHLKIAINFFNFEMTNVQQLLRFLLLKMLASDDPELNDIKSIKDIRNNYAKGGSFKVIVEEILAGVQNYPINFYENVGDISNVRNAIAKQIRLGYITINCYDHSRIVITDDNKDTEEVKLFKLMAMFNEAKKAEPLGLNIVLSQLNRAYETKLFETGKYSPPLLSHLFGGDSVGQFTDTCLMLHDPNNYGFSSIKVGDDEVSTANKLFCEVAKARNSDINGTIILSKHNAYIYDNG